MKLDVFRLEDFTSVKLKGISSISGGKERTTPSVPAGGSSKNSPGGTYDYGSGSFNYDSDTLCYNGDGSFSNGEYHQGGYATPTNPGDPTPGEPGY